MKQVTKSKNDSEAAAIAIDPSAQTPFVIYESGTANYIANSIYTVAESAINIFLSCSVEVAIAEIHGRTGTVGYRLHGAEPSAVWMAYLELFLTRQGGDTPSLAERLDMLQCMVQTPPESGWAAIREYILKNVDTLSGWAASHVRIFRSEIKSFGVMTDCTIDMAKMGFCIRSLAPRLCVRLVWISLAIICSASMET